jgi:hypothetical protein
VLISFALEILTLLWGPVNDASVPHLVETDPLTPNTLSLGDASRAPPGTIKPPTSVGPATRSPASRSPGGVAG